MSREALRAFFEKVQGDPGLQAQVKTIYANNQAQAQTSIIQLASEHGFQFTLNDLEHLAAGAKAEATNSGELQDAELEAVTGGSTGGWVLVSALSFGIGCIVSAAVSCDPSVRGKEDGLFGP